MPCSATQALLCLRRLANPNRQCVSRSFLKLTRLLLRRLCKPQPQAGRKARASLSPIRVPQPRMTSPRLGKTGLTPPTTAMAMRPSQTRQSMCQHEPELGSLGSPPPPPALRSLPVREVAAPSLRADVPHAAGPAAVQATPQGDVWLDVVQGLMAQEVITALVRELALQSQLLARDADQWQLRVERETLNHPASRDRLQAALQAAGHGDVKLQIEIGPVTDSPAKRLAVKAAEKMLAAQALIQNDPLVQAMVRDFGAKIVPGSLQLI